MLCNSSVLTDDQAGEMQPQYGCTPHTDIIILYGSVVTCNCRNLLLGLLKSLSLNMSKMNVRLLDSAES